MNNQRGSIWRKWDLHVHTPYSIVHNYSVSPGTDVWESFISDLESLPQEFKAIGINDYLFLDGYKKVLEEKAAGRLKNIDLIMPVIELRLDKFGGTTNHLSRVNWHIIFSPEILPEVIEAQFIAALGTKYKLSPAYEELSTQWNATITKESLRELGDKIIASVPTEEKCNFGIPIVEGFSNLNFSIDHVCEIIEKPCFKDKVISMVGKTEWYNIKWTDRSIADKKNIINSADLVCIASKNIEEYEKAKKSLDDALVNSRLIDCSDAHYFSNTDQKDRIGNCSTWIKADTTFQGLQMAIKEFKERVSVISKPLIFENVQKYSRKYIDSIRIVPKDNAAQVDIWFNQELLLNSGLVAIIGNKGSGKSALTDIIALAANSHLDTEEFFSFLTTKKFRKKPENKAKDYMAHLRWVDGESVPKGLDEAANTENVERVQYLPQNYFERLCTEILSADQTEFEKQVESVIFSHIPQRERQDCSNLKELLTIKTSECEHAVEMFRTKIKELNDQIIRYEKDGSIESLRSLESTLTARINDLKAIVSAKPVAVHEPDAKTTSDTLKPISDNLAVLNATILELDKEIIQKNKEQSDLVVKLQIIERLLQRIHNLDRTFTDFQSESESDFNQLHVSFESVIKYKTQTDVLVLLQDFYKQSKAMTDKLLDTKGDGSLLVRREQIMQSISDLQKQLNGPAREYEEYKQKLRKWKEDKAAILCDESKENSIRNIRKKIRKWKEIPALLTPLRQQRLATSIEIYRCFENLVIEYKKSYGFAEKFLSEIDFVGSELQDFEFKFEAALVFHQIEDRFFAMISKSAAGSFNGDRTGSQMLTNLIQGYNLDSEDNMQAFLIDFYEHLTNDKRQGKSNPVLIEPQLKKGFLPKDVYDFIYGLEYLRPQYQLKLGNKTLNQLSPGERGTVLLIFYLLMNLSEIPLLIDQPEENLDNQSVYNMLRHFIKWSKNKRQVIMVTHNPNLAVVCDADQIIYAHFDSKKTPKINYLTGSIENPELNIKLLNVLEGTRPAFDNRDSKYYISN